MKMPHNAELLERLKRAEERLATEREENKRLTDGWNEENAKFRQERAWKEGAEFCLVEAQLKVQKLEQQLASVTAELEKVRNERAALSLTISDLSGSLRDAAHKGKGHVCDYRSVCDSLRDKIKGHRERHELTVTAFASMNDRAAMQKLRDQLKTAESESEGLRKELAALKGAK